MTLAGKAAEASAAITDQASAVDATSNILALLRAGAAGGAIDEATLIVRAGGETIKLNATRPETIAALLGCPAEVVP